MTASAGIPTGPGIPDWIPPASIQDQLSRVDGFRSLEEFGNLVGSDATALAEAALESGEHVFVPYREGGWNVDGPVIFPVDSQASWWGLGEASLIVQQTYGMMTFLIPPNAERVRMHDLGFTYADAKGALPSWSFSELDAATNALVNQDSNISRSAFMYCMGSDVGVWNLYGRQGHALMRFRSPDRFVDQVVDNYVGPTWVDDFEFGLIVMNQVGGRFEASRGRHTGATGPNGAPPHLLYCAGGGMTPTEITDPDTVSPDDTRNEGCTFTSFHDRDNPYSSSVKFRNLSNCLINEVHSVDAPRALELAYAENVTVNVVRASNVIRQIDRATGLPGTDSVGAAVIVSYSSDCRLHGLDIDLADADNVSGIRVEQSTEIRFVEPRIKGEFAAGTTTHAFIKCVDSNDIWFERPSWELDGVDSPAVRLANCDRVHVIDPGIDSAFNQDIIVVDANCADCEFVLDRELIAPKLLAVADMFNDSGANTQIRFRNRGVFLLRVRTTNATATSLTKDGKALSTDNVLWIPPNTVQRVTGQVVARDIATGDAAIWTVLFSVRRGSGTANPVFIGTSTPTKETSDAGAATWTLVNNVDNTRDSINLFGTGEAAKTIEWRARVVFAGEV